MKMHTLWTKLRGPFFSLGCRHESEHVWEQFDCNKAGCLQCGHIHQCCDNVSFNKCCRLEQQPDGSFSCTITGLSVACIRVGTREFFDHCVFEKKEYSDERSAWEQTYDEVNYVVNNFFCHNNMTLCKNKEHKKKIHRIQSAAVVYLKTFKLKNPGRGVLFHDMLAYAIHRAKVPYSTDPSPELIDQCVTNISRAVIDLHLQKSTNDRANIIIGMLYLMKSGLEYQREFWLPKVPGLNNCLPHENSLEKCFDISVKIICDTENTIKMILRGRRKML